ncbi:MAG: hypothetical protein MZV64_70550 [Ignavibacteriales bacterium]|nr:hypothetical protein [Ignavibacteriales bacterium]
MLQPLLPLARFRRPVHAVSPRLDRVPDAGQGGWATWPWCSSPCSRMVCGQDRPDGQGWHIFSLGLHHRHAARSSMGIVATLMIRYAAGVGGVPPPDPRRPSAHCERRRVRDTPVESVPPLAVMSGRPGSKPLCGRQNVLLDGRRCPPCLTADAARQGRSIQRLAFAPLGPLPVHESQRRLRLERSTGQSAWRISPCGSSSWAAGASGSHPASTLSAERHEVVVIDTQPRVSFSRLPRDFTGRMLTGIGFDREILQKADIESAEALARNDGQRQREHRGGRDRQGDLQGPARGGAHLRVHRPRRSIGARESRR